MRKINKIIVHCTATPAGRTVTVADVDKWHKERGWSGIGYHYLIGINGEVWKGRDESAVGAHVSGQNADSIGVAYAGGLTASGKLSTDTRTAAQKASLLKLIKELKAKYPNAKVFGHSDFSNKACPCFDAKSEYVNI